MPFSGVRDSQASIGESEPKRIKSCSSLYGKYFRDSLLNK
ncbi:hypothetical protein J2T18_002929 [Paenibacillus polymyxa]|nr:hypothetical protein [Paenibacillus polymyxa]